MAKQSTHSRIHTEVISLLRQSREQIPMSMTQLAQESGLSLSMISYIERELRKPTLETLLRIAEALDVDLGVLIQRARRAVKDTGTAR